MSELPPKLPRNDFAAFQRQAEGDPWGCELFLNMKFITKIEARYYTKPDHEGASYKYSVKEGRADPEAERWFDVYVGGDKVTITPRRGKLYTMIEQICSGSLLTENLPFEDDEPDEPNK